MGRRIKIRFADVNINQQLTAYFGEMFNLLDKKVAGATRIGIYKTINSIAARARSNVLGSWFNATKPIRGNKKRPSGLPLIYGIRAYMYDKQLNKAAGRTHILGDTKNNDGTYLLRMFSSGGTETRISKEKGREYGHIRGDRWFVNAIQGADALAVQNVEAAIDNMIKKNFN